MGLDRYASLKAHPIEFKRGAMFILYSEISEFEKVRHEEQSGAFIGEQSALFENPLLVLTLQSHTVQHRPPNLVTFVLVYLCVPHCSAYSYALLRL